MVQEIHIKLFPIAIWYIYQKIIFPDIKGHPAVQKKIIKQKIASCPACEAGLKIFCLLHMKLVLLNFLALVCSPIDLTKFIQQMSSSEE